MKAMVLLEYGQPLQLEEVEMPSPGPREVLVKVKACGVCGTDVKISAGILPGTKIPLVMGHEPAGTVSAVGNEVRGLRPGDHVSVHFYVTCGRCEYCRSGRETICPNLAGQLGFHINGGFAEYVMAPEENCIILPKQVLFDHAAILGDAVATSFRAIVTKGMVKPGETVLVMGAGGVGLHAVQVAKIAGADVVAVDISEEKLALSRQLGADAAILYEEGNYLSELKKVTASCGVHLVVETVGEPETLALNLSAVRRGGKLVVVGYKPGKRFPADPLDLLNREITVHGSRASTKDELRQVVGLVASNKLKPVVTREFSLIQINEALRLLKHNQVVSRAVVRPDP